jgi:hypothetical protein
VFSDTILPPALAVCNPTNLYGLWNSETARCALAKRFVAFAEFTLYAAERALAECGVDTLAALTLGRDEGSRST